MGELTDVLVQQLDIVDVASQYVSLKRSGSNYVGLSPFKQERTPSFVVSPHKQIFKCFSSGVGGNVVSLVMELERIDYLDAVKLLADKYNVDISPYLHTSGQGSSKNDSKRQMLKRINKVYLSYIRSQWEGSSAESYAESIRKLEMEVIKDFQLGYAPEDSKKCIDFLVSQGFSHDDMLAAGLIKENERGRYCFFRHRLLFPIWDHMHHVVGFGGRALQEGQQPKYLNTPETALYDKSKTLYGIHLVKQHVRTYEKIVIVEGYMDVIAMAQAGVPVAVATCGTSLTPHHIKLLQRYTDDVLFMFDNDSAGLQATIKGLSLAYARNVFPRMISLDDQYKDIDDVVRVKGDQAGEYVSSLLADARDGLHWVFEQLYAMYRKDGPSPVKEQRMLARIFDIIYSIQRPTVQRYYLDYIANQLDVETSYITTQYTQYIKSGRKYSRIQSTYEEEKAVYQPQKAMLLAALWWQKYVYTHFPEEYSPVQKMYMLLDTLMKYVDEDHILSRVWHDTLDVATQTILTQEQLWWDQQWSTYTEPQDKRDMLLQVVSNELQTMVKVVIKKSTLTLQDKQDIVRLFSSLRGH